MFRGMTAPVLEPAGDAITEGDTAIMLEQIEPGLYTMNVGI